MQPSKKFMTAVLPTLLCIVAILVTACGGGGSGNNTTGHTKAAANKQVYVSAAQSGNADLSTFDPALVQDAFASSAIDLVFTGLVELGPDLNVHPQLAQSYSQGSDGVTWTFHLKPNLKFSDGTPLTSQDVVYSINRALDPATNSSVAPYYLRYIKDSDKFGAKKINTLIGDSLMAPDPSTVVIVAAKPVAFFLDTLVYPTSWVVEKSVVDKWGKSWTDHLADNGGQGGAGPFKVQEYTHSKQIVFVPNPNYYGPKPQLQKIVQPFYKVEDTTYQVYQVNQIDDTPVPSQDYVSAKTRSDFHTGPFLAINYYTMNYLQKPFDVTSCRQAFALAINKDLINSSVWKNSFIATNHIVPQGMPGYNPNLLGPDNTPGTAGDTTKAKQLWQNCLSTQGYASAAQVPPITLTYSSAGAQAVRNEVAALQQMWQTTLGVSVKTNDIDIDKLFSDEALGSSNPLMFYTGPAWLTDYPDPEDWTTLQFDKGAAQNGMSFGQNKGPDAAAQQQVQQEMEAADVMTNQQQRLAAYNKIEQELVNYVAWLPVEQQKINILRKPCVQGLVDNAAQVYPPDAWANIFISTDTPCANATA